MSVLVRTGALILAAAAPGLALAESYAEPRQVTAILGLWAVMSVLSTTLMSWRSASPAALLGGVPLALAGVAVLAVLYPGPQETVFAGTLDAVAHSGARILTASVPTPVAVDTLALPALATWLAGAAATLAARENRPLLAAACVLPPLLGAAALNGGVVSPGYVPAAAYAAAVVLLLAATAHAHSASPGSASDTPTATVSDRVSGNVAARWWRAARTSARSCSVAALTATAAVIVGYLGPFALYGSGVHPAEIRTTMDPPDEEEAVLNPLGYLSAWSEEPEQPLFTVTSTGPPSELRWVALSEFTGVMWAPDSGYQVAGNVLPEPEVTLPSPRAHTAEVSVLDLPGGWLPVPGTPLRLDGVPIGYDPESGTVRAESGNASGLDYTVTGAVPQWDPEELRAADAPEDEEFDRYRALPPDGPAAIAEIAAAVADEGSGYERANRLAAYLRETYTLDPHAPGGHGYANLDELLVPPGEPAGAGTTEQFASAFALLARQADLPSRVVVGFASGGSEDDDTGSQERTVHTGDAVAWGEVYLEETGWVPFDVTPGSETSDSGATAAEASEENGDGDAGSESEDMPLPQDEDESKPWSTWTSGTIVDWETLGDGAGRLGVTLLGVAVALLVTIPVARYGVRQHRLHHRDPDRRVVGAWRELQDGLRLAGRAPRPAETVTEILARADVLAPTAPPVGQWTLGPLVNQLAFGPDSGIHRVTSSAAGRAAAEARSYTRTLLAGQSRIRRLLWWLDPRPLIWLRR
ncbi:transglutaminaseTgpA domain-containing protein [Lipingzhangella sp. LS1_29]|uniref:TransglutaminaseTgpA domain-containing protein n=1 Tax=Lipingzhangella rawalii TaxID=2055835 RepID=A0ABU2H4J8_9ACTN|nr:transglutaminaseTgpA domain-containing protein [Lipingzhangella rawalii]MDS1270220.1 transglutaminaseTgpA domain-containing protein [Lipingzhangella rawalii]